MAHPLELLMARFSARGAMSPGLPSYRGVIETVHCIPGRLRLHIPAANGDAGALARLKDLERIPSVSAVESNAVTGSVVIRYDSGSVDPMLLFGAVIRLLELEKQIEARPQPLLWREFQMAGRAVNDTLYHASAGVLDLKTFVALGLIGTLAHGLVTRSIQMSAPGGFTLAWWIYLHLFADKPS